MSNWQKFLLRLFFTISSAVTIYSYVEPNFSKVQGKEFSILKLLLSSAVAFFLITVIILDNLDAIKEYKKTFDTRDSKFSRRINEYMRHWIKQGARTVIVTRDMSWANNDATKTLLLKKSQERELVICLPKNIPLSQELQNAGAEVYTYPDLNYVLKSRFTIIRQGQTGSEVAVGIGSGSKHKIEEYQEGMHPCYALANDLFEVIRRISELQKENKAPVRSRNRKSK